MAKLLLATCLLPLTWAFSDTAPLLAWSSHKALLSNNFFETGEMLFNDISPIKTILADAELCEFDAVVIVDQPGLHAYDLSTLSSASAIPSRLEKARKSMQIPYTRRGSSENLADTVESLARRCGAHFEQFSGLTVDRLVVNPSQTKQVLYILLPSIIGEGSWRREIMAELENALARTLSDIESAFPGHLFIYTGSVTPGFDKRQLPGADISPPFSFAPQANDTNTGILHRYQLLSPGLIVSLLVAFFLLAPIIMFAIRALASIQSSVRLDAPKGPSQEKKNQ